MISRKGSADVGAWADLLPSLSGRGAAAAMFAAFLLTDLCAGALHMTGLSGFGFAAATAVVAGCTRRGDLMVVATAPPAIFVVAVTCAELITIHLDHVAISAGTVLAGVFLTLAAAAPWLFGGLAGALVIASVRGLPECIRDLRARLSGYPSTPGRGTRRYPEIPRDFGRR